MNGWLILDKPVGIGSTQCVGAVKRVMRENGYAKVKVGHGGTLDPLASGVLPIALGEATKLAGRMLDARKAYDFTIGFGAETDGLDAEGAVVATSDVRPSLTEIEAVLARFTGLISQIPSAYSAIKIDGKRAYDRARAGEVVEMKAREVEVYSLAPLPLRGGVGVGYSDGVSAHPAVTSQQAGKSRCPSPKGEGLDSITLSAQVSKGTYIRSLARDIAYALGTVGHVTMLRRTKAGAFTLDQAISLDNLEKIAMAHALEETLLPIEAGLDDIPALSLTPDEAVATRQGRQLSGLKTEDGLYLAKAGDVPVALVEVTSGVTRVVRGFNL